MRIYGTLNEGFVEFMEFVSFYKFYPSSEALKAQNTFIILLCPMICPKNKTSENSRSFVLWSECYADYLGGALAWFDSIFVTF